MLFAPESTLEAVRTYADRFNAGLARPGKSRKGAAEAIGISVQAVGAIANGNPKSATAENNVAAANYFGCDANWLATGKGEPAWRPDLMLSAADGEVVAVIEAKSQVAKPPEPPKPDAKFTDRRLPPSESEWAVLDALRTFPQEERDRIGTEMSQKAEYWRRIATELLKARSGN